MPFSSKSVTSSYNDGQVEKNFSTKEKPNCTQTTHTERDRQYNAMQCMWLEEEEEEDEAKGKPKVKVLLARKELVLTKGGCLLFVTHSSIQLIQFGL